MAESFRVTSGGRPIESENMGVRLANRIAQVFTSANRDCVIDVWSDEGLHKLKLVSRHTDDTIVDVAKEALKLSGVVKEEALVYLRAERDRLLGLSHKQAVEELVRMAGLDSRIFTVEKIEHGQLLGGLNQ